MKQIFTLFTAMAVLFAMSSNAQTETFDGGTSSLISNCWKFSTVTEVNSSSTTGTPISVVSVATDATGLSSISTPYYDLAGTTTLSFKYKLNQKLTGLATRTIEIGSVDVNNVFTAVPSATIFLDKNNSPLTTQLSATITIPHTGVKRLSIRVTAANGAGQAYVIIDDLAISNAGYHYNPSTCNSAPTAGNDNFATILSTPYSGNVLGNDSDPNTGELITASLVSAPAASAGTVSFSSNGNFTFTPAAGFTGGPVTFTYNLTDNGYDPLSSNTATVTITYPELAPLPIQLVSFSGSLVNNKAQVKWLVEENETGSHFEIEKSSDGKNFSSIGLVMTSDKVGSENYTYTETSELIGEAYYRLKIVNKNNSISQSRIIVLKNQKAGKSNSLAVMQNPVESMLAFNYTASKPGASMINIYNLSGIKVFTTHLNAQAGLNSLSLSVGNKLSSGAYVLEVVNGADRSVTKIIKK